MPSIHLAAPWLAGFREITCPGVFHDVLHQMPAACCARPAPRMYLLCLAFWPGKQVWVGARLEVEVSMSNMMAQSGTACNDRAVCS